MKYTNIISMINNTIDSEIKDINDEYEHIVKNISPGSNITEYVVRKNYALVSLESVRKELLNKVQLEVFHEN